MGVVCPLLDQLHNYILSFAQGCELIYLKIPSVNPLGLIEFLIKQGYFLPPHHHQVNPKVPLEHLRAMLHAIVVAYT